MVGRPPPAARAARHQMLLAVLRTLGTVGGILVLYFVLPLDRGFSAGTVGWLALGVVALALLVTWQVRSILLSHHPAVRAIEAIALSLPLFLVMFAATYVVLEGSDPHAFTEPLTRIDSLYFVVTVFATVGFGDIAPVAEGARLLVTLQMVGDLLLIGLVFRVFLTAVQHGRQRAAQQEGPPPLTPGG